MLAIDHADEAVTDRHVDVARARRHHPGAANTSDQKRIGNREVADQPRRDRAAARLDPSGLVEEQHAVSGRGEVRGRGCSGRAAAHHHDVEDLASVVVGHGATSPRIRG
jgi:hypothetical protein